jgi:hypothetical protein
MRLVQRKAKEAKTRGVDVSLVCFALVVSAAIPVALLRTKTFALGYELGALKAQEREHRQRNAELISQLASARREARDKLFANSNKSHLSLPSREQVVHGGEKNER